MPLSSDEPTFAEMIEELRHYDRQCRDWGLHPLEDILDPDLKAELKKDLAEIEAFLKAELEKRVKASREIEATQILEADIPW